MTRVIASRWIIRSVGKLVIVASEDSGMSSGNIAFKHRRSLDQRHSCVILPVLNMRVLCGKVVAVPESGACGVG